MIKSNLNQRDTDYCNKVQYTTCEETLVKCYNCQFSETFAHMEQIQLSTIAPASICHRMQSAFDWQISCRWLIPMWQIWSQWMWSYNWCAQESTANRYTYNYLKGLGSTAVKTQLWWQSISHRNAQGVLSGSCWQSPGFPFISFSFLPS